MRFSATTYFLEDAQETMPECLKKLKNTFDSVSRTLVQYTLGDKLGFPPNTVAEEAARELKGRRKEIQVVQANSTPEFAIGMEFLILLQIAHERGEQVCVTVETMPRGW